MYRTIHINPVLPGQSRSSVLVIYTGGTLGMVYDRQNDQLVPFDFDQVLDRVPEIRRLDFELTVIVLNELIDSSNMKPTNWINLGRIIRENYDAYDSFVILHGTDTMAYTASALSFLLDGLNKPVILTGAQLPIGVARSDARENFITAMEIAAAQENGRPMVPEVCIYFNSLLLRGNRAKKKESVHFNAFHSENYPHLAMAGVNIEYNTPFIRSYSPDSGLMVYEEMDTHVVALPLFPGINHKIISSILGIPGLKGLVLESYGAGNAPTETWFLHALEHAVERGLTIFNVSQCDGGRVTQGRYQTSKHLDKIGVLSGSDITMEAAITKLMFLLANEADPERLKKRLIEPICGEMSL
ncbi:asparaginase [Larkinella terrae]|uniref:asparaginase n=1 Tax=Larkinella terrae TaxID=2025311 RepID=A0A7K0EPJ4_9BACT|nr:asparaginase [Larkinella terrae]MRS63727.1 type I asparaginase [Larkinella terrae]